MFEKWAPQLGVEARILDWVPSALARVVTYDIIRNIFGQEFNRYVWELYPPQSVADYHSARY